MKISWIGRSTWTVGAPGINQKWKLIPLLQHVAPNLTLSALGTVNIKGWDQDLYKSPMSVILKPLATLVPILPISLGSGLGTLTRSVQAPCLQWVCSSQTTQGWRQVRCNRQPRKCWHGWQWLQVITSKQVQVFQTALSTLPNLISISRNFIIQSFITLPSTRLHGGGGVYLSDKDVEIGSDPFMYWQTNLADQVNS